MDSIKTVIEKHYKDSGNLAGIDFVRDAINYLDSRNETTNENKTPIQLLNDWATRIETYGKRY